ncbi:hypothetical protein COCVIDRAFT_41937 [Bipolaris victoriae FI3]|uniref:Uncharacterized protein n=1 Tax=Bipolaris victoriae (strain FI3) TaxID=930091 RepID=W7E195_BIPV3|nr:hypothetical protein COCVIDRAFT_41937 [Bipolaris victoriae FI3]
MTFRAFALLLTTSSFIAGGYSSNLHSSLFEKRQTCSTCPLGGNPIVKLVKFFATGGDPQSTVDCRYGMTTKECYTLTNDLLFSRMESVFGLPSDLGGQGAGDFEAAVRVNFDEDQLACSVEGVSLPIGNEIEDTVCIAGGCTVSEVTDQSALVTWGACIVRPNVPVVENQALTDAECLPAQGAIRFARFHDTGDCSGTETVTELTVSGRSTTEFSPNDGGGIFHGGIVTRCSTVAAA